MKVLVLILFFFQSYVLADTKAFQQLKEKQRNSWAIEVDENLGSTITEKSFYEIINKIYVLYIRNDFDRNLQLGVVDWKVPYMSAWAFETDEAFTINFWGGFARIPFMTERALALTVCHEVGHVLGGSPYHSIAESRNMSAEGQSDFFAASNCMKKYLDTYSIDNEVDGLHPTAAQKCFDGLVREKQRRMCYEIAKAAQELAAVFTFLHQDQVFSYDTPSLDVVSETLYNGYPSIQCRLDTFLAGALAPYPLEENIDLRPSCWFKK
ncbi:hypothetical protein [Halobacteriovorax sp. HLS]|uniref:hypothetical protein n=1 Tax=Halobacteriovorax sp. HLS TaxID=2234000 RepID=UPI000FD78A3E|nr:hypothetical protein [Halobacteriovorax sp. HLS]